MKLIKFLFLILLFSGVLSANEPILEVKAEGRHIEFRHSKENKKLQEIKLGGFLKNPLIQNPKQLVKKNLQAVKEVLEPTNRKLDIDKVWVGLKENPFMLFVECLDPDCPLNRVINPTPRTLFEQRVLKVVMDTKKNDSKLHLTFFGSSYLFDSLVNLSQILQNTHDLKVLEIDLVDNLYSEYINYIQSHKMQNLNYLKLDPVARQNWFNILTIRFAVFASILEEIAPDTKISIRIMSNLNDISQDQISGNLTSTPDFLIAEDLFDPGGGLYAFHDFIVHGTRASNKGATLLILMRDDKMSNHPYQMMEFVKCMSAEQTREEFEKMTYNQNDDQLKRMGKRINCGFMQIEAVIPK